MTDLPSTDAVIRALARAQTIEPAGIWYAAANDELGRLLARCLVRDEEETMEAEQEEARMAEQDDALDARRRHSLSLPLDLEPPPGAYRVLSVRSIHRLQEVGISRVWQLAALTEGELARRRLIGRKTRDEARDLLAGLGLSFGMADDPDVVALREAANG